MLQLDAPSDAASYAAQVECVIKSFGIERCNILGISVDNTAVNPAFERILKVRLLPCAMHVGNLMIEAAFSAFSATDLYG